MPGFDGTGPMGTGPRTGGGFGPCPPGYGRASYAGYGPVYGVGRGGFPRGGGRGWRWRANATAPPPAAYAPYFQPAGAAPSSESELSYLEDQVSALREEMDAIRSRIEEIKSAGAGER